MANGFVLGRRNDPLGGGLKWVTVYESGSTNALAIEPRAPDIAAPITDFTMPGIDPDTSYILWKIEYTYSEYKIATVSGTMAQLLNGTTRTMLNGENILFYIQTLLGDETYTIYAMTRSGSIVYNRISYAVIDDLI